MDQPKIERLLRLMKYLSSNVNYSIGELSRKLDMSPRTVYRYIDTFKSAGFSVVKLYSDVYKLLSMPKESVDLDKLIYFSEEEAYLVNTLIENLAPTNSLKANLKEKLSAIYSQTSIADFVDRKSNAAHVELLGEAIKNRRKAVLVNYQSASSHSTRDRLIEPYDFTSDYVDVCALDLEDGRNKIFKISRIGEVRMLDEEWTREGEHRRKGMDVFRFSGDTAQRVRLRMSTMAKNLLVEEFPLAIRDLSPDGEAWLLDTEVYSFVGIGRFYLGLASEISIVDSPEFEAYIADYVGRNFVRGAYRCSR